MLAVPASLALVRSRLPLKPVMNTPLMLPLVVPGVVLGAAFYVGELELSSSRPNGRCSAPSPGLSWRMRWS